MTASDIRLVHGDCLQVMPMLEDRSVDMILADLPYGTTNCSWDIRIPFEPLWAQYKRLIKPRGAIVLFGSQPFTTLLISSNMAWFKYCWVWEKSRVTGMLHAKNMPLKNHEDIAVFSSGVVNHESVSNNRMMYFPQLWRGRRYVKRQVNANVSGKGAYHGGASADAFAGTVSINSGFRLPTTSVYFEQGNHNPSHPNEKPTALLEYLIRTYTSTGETVMDNTMGSGSTMVACINAERNGIGIEMDATYYETANRRVAAAQAQLRLPL